MLVVEGRLGATVAALLIAGAGVLLGGELPARGGHTAGGERTSAGDGRAAMGQPVAVPLAAAAPPARSPLAPETWPPEVPPCPSPPSPHCSR